MRCKGNCEEDGGNRDTAIAVYDNHTGTELNDRHRDTT